MNNAELKQRRSIMINLSNRNSLIKKVPDTEKA